MRPILQAGISCSAGFGRALCPAQRLRLWTTLITLDVHKGLMGYPYSTQSNHGLSAQAQAVPAAALNSALLEAAARECAWALCPAVSFAARRSWWFQNQGHVPETR